jgi:prepilin-type N-terminal cleavage/methylation domain-containing protein
MAPAFTLIELTIVLAVMAALVMLTAILENKALRLQRAEQAAEIMRTELVTARNEAIANTHDGPWGLQMQSSTIVQFHGTNYAGRDQSFDKRLDFDSGIAVSGTRNYVFQVLSGMPTTPGETDFSDSGRIYRVMVNKYGAVSVQ